MGLRVLAVMVCAACGFTARTDPAGGPGGGDGSAGDAEVPFDLEQCPTGYAAIAGAPSRYRLGASPTYRIGYEDCKDDALGDTHTVVIETMAEGSALLGAAGNDYFTGAIQQPGQPPTMGWFEVTGGAVPDLWGSGEPNDTTDEKNVTRFTSDGLHDERPGEPMRQLCECDGRPVVPMIEAFLPP